mgnify:CR=1 FL=1
MIPPLTIIAATNFSSIANNAVTYAAGLAKATGAKVILFNSFSLSVHSANSLITAESMQKQMDKAALRIQTLGLEIADLFKISVESICSYSFLEDELPLIIERTKADVVVMGMAERSLEQDIMGNTTTSVIKNLKIPVLAVPVALIGSFTFMSMMGFSINLLTLFALVLSIGIVVDNAIVVVEAVHVKISEEHMSPMDATISAMKEITGAVIAITIVMAAVFIPVAFMSGPVGIFFRQFAITMATSIILIPYTKFDINT